MRMANHLCEGVNCFTCQSLSYATVEETGEWGNWIDIVEKGQERGGVCVDLYACYMMCQGSLRNTADWQTVLLKRWGIVQSANTHSTIVK